MASASGIPPVPADGGIAAVIARHAPRLMALAGVVGVGEGSRDGLPCLVVYLGHDEGIAGIPASLDGYAVIIEHSGPFEPQRNRPGPGG